MEKIIITLEDGTKADVDKEAFERIKAIVYIMLWCATIGRWYAWEEYKKEVVKKWQREGRI